VRKRKRNKKISIVCFCFYSTGAIRGNLLKKIMALNYLLSPAFGGLEYEKMKLTRESFRRFKGDGFYDNMYFFARKAVTVRDDEDVFGMFLDNEVLHQSIKNSVADLVFCTRTLFFPVLWSLLI
jgi:hypothetical protein